MVRKTLLMYLLVSSLFGLGMSFISATYVLFLRERGMDVLQIQMINSVFFLTVAFFEVPTGILADLFGRKISVLLSGMLLSTSMFLYGGSVSFGECLVAEAVGAVGLACMSGALQAWAVDRMNYFGRTGSLDRVFSAEQTFKSILQILGTLAGGWMGEKNLALPWFASGSVFAFLAGVAFLFLQEEYFLPTSFSFVGSLRGVLRTFGSSTRRLGDPTIRFLFLCGILLAVAVQAPNMQWPIRFGFSPFGSSCLFVAITVSFLLGSFFAGRLSSTGFRRQVLLVLALGVAGIGMVLSAFGGSVFSLGAFLFHEIGRGLFQPLKEAALNERIPVSQDRATVLSLDSFATHLGGACGLLGSGWMAQVVGMDPTWILSGAVLLVGSAFLWFLFLRK